MVNQEPWEEDESGYTDSDELNDPRSSDRDRLMESERDVHGGIAPPSPVANGAQGHAGDPVSLGYLTLDEAKVLFNLFVKHFNVAMPVMDPITHTHGTCCLLYRILPLFECQDVFKLTASDFVRHHSPFLYTVVCEY
jgi:hypothetical protein